MFNFFGKSKKQKTIDELIARIENEKQLLEKEINILDTVSVSSLEQLYAFLEERDLPKATEEMKNTTKKQGMPLPKVAFPAEYYHALIFILRIFTEKWRKIRSDAENVNVLDDIEEEQESLRYNINVYYDSKLSEYIKKSKPKLSVGGIFNNASQSLNKYSQNETESTSYSIKCKACGAARLEEDQCDECFYCGTPLF